MQTSVEETKRKSGGTFVSFVKKEYKKGYAIELLPYQTAGIMSRVLWPTKDHIIRILPGYDPATGQLYRQNINCNEYAEDASPADYLSDTFMMARIVSGFGERRQMFITDYAPGSPEAAKWGGSTVMEVFNRSVYNAVNTQNGKKPRFHVSESMRRWAGSMNGIVRIPRPAFLMQSLIFKVNGKANEADGVPMVDGDGDTLPLLGVVAIDHTESYNNLMRALVEPANKAMALDSISNNSYGPFAEPDGIELFLNTAMGIKQKPALKPSVQVPGKGWTPTPYPLTDDQIKSLWVPWEDLLYYMTPEEQLRMLVAEFGAPVVNYIIGTDPMFSSLEIPDDIKAAGLGEYAPYVGGGSANITGTSQPTRAPLPQLAVPRATSKGLGTGNSGLGKPAGLPKPAPVEQPEEPEYVAPQRPGLTGLPKSNPVTSSAVQAELAKMRAAGMKKAAMPASVQADRAASLLDAEDIPEEFEVDFGDDLNG